MLDSGGVCELMCLVVTYCGCILGRQQATTNLAQLVLVDKIQVYLFWHWVINTNVFRFFYTCVLV